MPLDSWIKSGVWSLQRVQIFALPSDDNPVALKEPAPLVELSGHDVTLVVDFHLKRISVKLQLELHARFGKEVPVRFLDVPVPVARLRLSDHSRIFFQDITALHDSGKKASWNRF